MKSQAITPEIRKALWEWYNEGKLTQTQMGELIGVGNPSINDWLNENVKTIRPRNWEKLFPHIEKYLSPEAKMKLKNSAIVNGDHAIGIVHGSVNTCGPEIEDFRRRIQDAIMASNLDGDIKVQVYQLVGGVSERRS